MDVVLNLIPFNPIYAAGINYQAPSRETVLQFQSIVNEDYQILCTVRQEKGQDIAGTPVPWTSISETSFTGACGQLAVIHPRDSENHSMQDVEDLLRC